MEFAKRITGNQLKCKDVFDNTDMAFCIGENIARLHKVLKDFDEIACTDVNIKNDVIHSALPNIKSVMNLRDDFVHNYVEKFGLIYEKLPKQIIHRDINPSNIIFDNGEFKGFVDFDLSEINIRIFDICYFATAILSECFSDSNIDKNLWFVILNKLVSGYEKETVLTDDEKQAVPYVIYSIQMICIAHFSKFDKFKDLAKINIDILEWIIKKFGE